MPVNDDPLPSPFIVGVGRSGTTLLRLMLDCHPALAIPAETHFLPQVFSVAQQTGDPVQVCKAFTDAATWPNMNLTAEELFSELKAEQILTAATAARVFYRLYAKRQGKIRWGDKTPPYGKFIEQIASRLPESYFIHMIRDGRDVALSFRGLWFGPADDIVAQARFWAEQVKDVREQGSKIGRYREVRFEDLVANPGQELRAMCDWLGLDYRAEMLEYHRRAKTRLAEMVQPFGPPQGPLPTLHRFLAIHDKTQHPPDEARIGRWKSELTSEEQRAFAEVAGPTLELLGYQV